MEGYGVYEYTSNILEFHTKKSEGFFVADELYGTGNETITWSEKNVKQTYEGEFWYGKYHGIGNYEYSEDGYSENYKGTFSNGLKNGKGVRYRKWNKNNAVETYDGNFVDNKYQGKGISSYSNYNYSSNYEGDFYDNKKHGMGVLTKKWKQNNEVDVYKGEFANGEYNGKGVLNVTYEGGYYLSHKFVKDGFFKNGELDGEFTYTEVIESENPTYKYVTITYTRFDLEFVAEGKKTFKINIHGNLKDGKLNGYAKITTSAGKYYDGIFKDGKFLEK